MAAGRGDFPFSNVRLLKDELSGGQPGGEEWHPMDPAYSMPQLLSALWHMIADGRSMVRGVRTVYRTVYIIITLVSIFIQY